MNEPFLSLIIGPFKCPECLKAFISVSDINKHVKVVHASKSGKLLKIVKKNVINFRKTKKSKASNVAKFIIDKYNEEKVPSNQSKFQCTYCDKRFNCNSHLKIHTRIHTGEREFFNW